MGQWHHVVCVFNGAGSTNAERMQIYINGVAQPITFTGTIPATLVDNSHAVNIGGKLNVAGFLGAMDEVRIYNRALSAGEAKGLYDVGESDKVNSSISQAQGTGRLDSGLAGYWPLDNGSGTTATDLSVNGNNGTVPNSWTTGQVGGAVSFDGTTSMTVAAGTGVIDAKQDVTLSAWVYPRSTGLYRAWFYKGVSGCDEGTAKYMFENDVSGLLRFWMGGSSLSSTTSLATNQWQHILATNSASGSAIYVNGVVVASGSGMAAPASSSEDWTFNKCNRIDANMDEIRIYNRALSVDEVRQLYQLNTPSGTDTSLKGYWSFNGKDMSGTTAYDRSGAGNNGTLTNGPAITEGKIGQALSFDGTNDYVDLGSAASLDNLSAMTLSAWIRPDSMGENSKGRIFDKTSDPTPGSGWILNIADNESSYQLGFVVDYSVTDIARRTTGGAISPNVWQHVAVTWDGSTTATNIKMYINGVEASYQVATDASGSRVTDAAQSLLIGETTAQTRAFDGNIDEARIYNRVLTEAEIKSLYNSSR